MPAVELCPEGLRLGERVVPLLAGAAHYWRLEPARWRPALEAVRAMGFHLVDTYVPWSAHEVAAGEYDFGAKEARLDVGRFLDLAAEVGLLAVVRPGPHVNAELTGFGVPERVLWDPACQARSPAGNPVFLPAPPLAFPVPSYASESFHLEAAAWLSAAARVLAPRLWPSGPVVLVQVDNEGSYYFRDGVRDQDHHPDAIAAWRRFLQARHGTVERLRRAHGDASATFATVLPPPPLEGVALEELPRHLDWAEHQEQVLATALARMREALREGGVRGVPFSHNLPPAEGVTALDPARVGTVVDLLGLDYYHAASREHRTRIARRTMELVSRAEERGHPPIACELGAGFPPFFPPLTEHDNHFAALTALAYGLRGFHLYMAVDRDRWIGAPIDSQGRPRPAAEAWRRLLGAFERLELHRLRRPVEVAVVVPRSLRRLRRVQHAFGPITAAFFEVAGAGAPEACFEDRLGLPAPPAIEAEEAFLVVEATLDRLRVHWTIAGGDLLAPVAQRVRWCIVISCGGLEPSVASAAAGALEAGRAVSFCPRPVERDDLQRALPGPLDFPVPPPPVPLLLGPDPARITGVIEQVAEALALRRMTAEPAAVHTTLLVDGEGAPRAIFAINPTTTPLDASLDLAGARSVRDAIEDRPLEAAGGRLRLTLGPRSVTLLELRDAPPFARRVPA